MKKKRDIGRCIIGVSAGLAVIGCTYGCKHILKQEYDQEYDNEDISGADPSDIDEQDDKPAEALLEKAELKDLDTAVMENQNGEPVFAFSIDDFIDSYNGLYWKDRKIRYLLPSWEWKSYLYDSGIHSRYKTCCYNFANDEEIQGFPTISVYVPANDDHVQEITVNFDDHSYTDQLYKVYEKMCFYTLKALFPDLADEKLIELYTTLNQIAYDIITTQKYSSESVPPALYYRGEIGVYPYFAIGECVHLCIIPVTGQSIEEYKNKGVPVQEIMQDE